jgi:hypothetical protein
VRLFIIVLVSMCVIAFIVGAFGAWLLWELVRFATYCAAQGGRC